MNYINTRAADDFISAAAAALADAVASEYGHLPAPSADVSSYLEWGVHTAIDVAAEQADNSAIVSALVLFGHASPFAMVALPEGELREYATENVGLLQEVAGRARALCM